MKSLKTLEERMQLGKPELRLLNILLKARRPVDTYEAAREYFKGTGKVTKYPHVYIATIARHLVYKTQNNPNSEVVVMKTDPKGSIPVEMWVEKRRKV
jgi:hypothetical protein